ncbi:unnamed protein product [Macrosiphum euphorbiae]|uniref:PiggyBac transposable element-derived protein domain-containing protein n=1 Tax=Macrosiphum euphorbiae TaxID=13131 RepID=A0AAV0WMT4_9HEMI|nr:unnamed protein product [Macrosiphum euphorbiae]
MPVNRFSWLLSHLHLNDNSVIPKKGDANYDKLYKVRPFLNLVLKNSQAVYNPNRIVAIDESMIKFKGRHSSKQYMPKKPIKRGYKVWALADNYPLMSYLKSNGIYACETVNMTRKHLPQQKDDKSLKQGKYDWNTDQFSISIIKWKDKRSRKLKNKSFVPDSLRLEKSAHQPKISTRRCAKCCTREKEVRTEWMCAVCNVPLCITKNRNCFADHHK